MMLFHLSILYSHFTYYHNTFQSLSSPYLPSFDNDYNSSQLPYFSPFFRIFKRNPDPNVLNLANKFIQLDYEPHIYAQSVIMSTNILGDYFDNCFNLYDIPTINTRSYPTTVIFI